MIIIGITGPTGAGKTTALRVLEELDGHIIDADAVYHGLLANNMSLRAELEARFGPLTDPDGSFERKKLGAVVFNDPAALEDLNVITHRYIGAAIRGEIAKAEEQGRAAAAIDAIRLFESGLGELCHTTVAIATICYYLAPAFVTLGSPLVGEKLTAKKLGCIAIAMVGMVFVSGVFQGNQSGSLMGILLGVGAAVFYASVILLNKKLSPIGAYDKTLCQLGAASIIVAPYILLSGGISFSEMSALGWVMLVVVGIVHTGIAYALYFGGIRDVNAQTAAILSYLDPVLSIILSALILRERLDVFSVIGAVLILGGALYSELPDRKK